LLHRLSLHRELRLRRARARRSENGHASGASVLEHVPRCLLGFLLRRLLRCPLRQMLSCLSRCLSETPLNALQHRLFRRLLLRLLRRAERILRRPQRVQLVEDPGPDRVGPRRRRLLLAPAGRRRVTPAACRGGDGAVLQLTTLVWGLWRF
jgi:hypothetical protein